MDHDELTPSVYTPRYSDRWPQGQNRFPRGTPSLPLIRLDILPGAPLHPMDRGFRGRGLEVRS